MEYTHIIINPIKRELLGKLVRPVGRLNYESEKGGRVILFDIEIKELPFTVVERRVEKTQRYFLGIPYNFETGRVDYIVEYPDGLRKIMTKNEIIKSVQK